MTPFQQLLQRSAVHPEWTALLETAGETLDAAYVQSLLDEDNWLPGADRIFAAFQRDRAGLSYLLFGESPYPRRESANGIAFYDAAVDSLWSDKGLSKSVNRATSLRNIMKTALIAEGLVHPGADGKVTQDMIAAIPKQGLLQSIGELFTALHWAGFLMLNATPVLHPERNPRQDARQWQPFMQRFLELLLAEQKGQPPTLVLWGKIAEQIQAIPCASSYPQLVCEHPYNISFIDNPDMRRLFSSLRLLTSHT